jgi:hypothetical protein
MRRKRNWILRRLVLGFALVALVLPSAAMARVDEGIAGQPNSASEANSAPQGYVPFVTDFPRYKAVIQDTVEIGGPRMQITGMSSQLVNGPYGFPRAMPLDYGLQNGDLIESVRLNPRTTGRDYDLIENRRADTPRASTPVAVASPGFDWRDAGIGAALALGLVLFAAAAVLTSRQLQKPQTA